MNKYEDDIRRYHDGSMTGSERNALEKKALDDPFLSDALEGAETISAKDFSNDLSKLSRRIQSRQQAKFIPLRIAAGIVIVLTAGSLFYFLNFKGPDPLATQELKPAGSGDSISSGTGPDSSSTMIALSKEVPSKEKIGSPAQQPVAFTTPLDTSVTTAADVQVEEQPVSPVKTENETVERIAATPAQKSVQIPAVAAEESKSAGASSRKDAAMKRVVEDVSPISEIVILDLSNSNEARDDAAKPSTQMAAPIGGTEAFNNYVEINLRFPQQALDHKVYGKVTITFTVTTTGGLTDFKVIDGPGYGCNEEAIRLVKEGPGWTPSMSDGKALKSVVCVRLQFDPARANK